jgi:hypothetical protein
MPASKDAFQQGTEAALSMLSPGGVAKAIIVPAFAVKKLGEVRAAEKILAGSRPTKANQQAAWDATGIYKDPVDKQLKAVIPDTNAAIRSDAIAAGDVVKHPLIFPHTAYDAWYEPANLTKGARVGDVLEHPELFSKQPYLADIKIANLPFSLGGASFDPNTNLIRIAAQGGQKDFITALLHELQHGVQNNYGFTPGGSPSMFLSDPKALNNARMQIDKAIEHAKNIGMPPGLINTLKSYDDELRATAKAAQLKYMELGGEVESRIVEHMFKTGNYSQNPATLVTEVLKSTPFFKAAPVKANPPQFDMAPEVQAILQNLDILNVPPKAKP